MSDARTELATHRGYARAYTDLEQSAILGTDSLNGCFGRAKRTLSARDAKYNFGRLIDTARAVPVTPEKYVRAIVVVLGLRNTSG